MITGQESEDDLGTGKQVRSKVWDSVYKDSVLAFIRAFVFIFIKHEGGSMFNFEKTVHQGVDLNMKGFVSYTSKL